MPAVVAPSHVSIAGSNQAVDDDDFGDFDGAQPVFPAAPTAHTAPTAPAPHTSDGDDFGDFDAAPITQTPVSPVPISASPNASDDDGFLAFDGATATALVSPSTISPTMPATSSFPVKSYIEV